MNKILVVGRRALLTITATVLMAASMSMIFSGPVTAQLADSAWPQIGHDPQHTSRSPYIGPTEKNVKWMLDIDRNISTSPAIAEDGTIYFGTEDNGEGYPPMFYAVNPDGVVQWSYAMSGNSDASPAIAEDGTIYTASNGDGGVIYAFNPNGTVKWTFSTIVNGIGGAIESSFTIGDDDTIYVGTTNSRLYAINPDGTLKWAFQTGAFVNRSSPALATDGTIYIAAGDIVYAVNPNGTQKWSYDMDAPTNASPSIGADGTIYIGTDPATVPNKGSVFAFNPNGTVKWRFFTDFNEMVRSNVAIAGDGTLRFGIAYDENSKLYSLNTDGTVRWTYTTGPIAAGSSPLVDANGTTYVSTSNPLSPVNATYAINTNGTLLWAHEHNANGVNTPALNSDGTLYVTVNDQLTAFSVDPVPDTVSPLVTGTPDRASNANGWYNANVTITWSATDPAPSSGTPTQPANTVATQEGTHTYTSGQSCDPAANCATGSLVLKIDKTRPTVSSAQAAGFIKLRNQPMALTATAADNLSLFRGEFFVDTDPGVGNGTAMTRTGNTLNGTITTSQTGFHVIGVRSVDSAGNWSTVRYTYIFVL